MLYFFILVNWDSPRINTAGSPAGIMDWKRDSAVAKCYDLLFANNYKVLVEIVDKVFAEKKYSDLQMAYVIAICTTFLNPRNHQIKCKEALMRRKIKYYLVSFIIFFFYLALFCLKFNNTNFRIKSKINSVLSLMVFMMMKATMMKEMKEI